LFNSAKNFKIKHSGLNEKEAEIAAWEDVKQTMAIKEDKFLINVFTGKRVLNPNY